MRAGPGVGLADEIWLPLAKLVSSAGPGWRSTGDFKAALAEKPCGVDAEDAGAENKVRAS